MSIDRGALSLIQEGLRGVVRLPTGTAHALASRGFPIAVMGKTGTTSDFRDAIFVGSTYAPDGITAAVRIGFDENRSWDRRENACAVMHTIPQHQRATAIAPVQASVRT